MRPSAPLYTPSSEKSLRLPLSKITLSLGLSYHHTASCLINGHAQSISQTLAAAEGPLLEFVQSVPSALE